MPGRAKENTRSNSCARLDDLGIRFVDEQSDDVRRHHELNDGHHTQRREREEAHALGDILCALRIARAEALADECRRRRPQREGGQNRDFERPQRDGVRRKLIRPEARTTMRVYTRNASMNWPSSSADGQRQCGRVARTIRDSSAKILRDIEPKRRNTAHQERAR